MPTTTTQQIDLNADMGEGFGPWVIGGGIDQRIMPHISSANIATGFHAGDPQTMRQTIRAAAAAGVQIGAHPGFRDLVGFGRRHIAASPEELTNDVLYQLGALREMAAAEGQMLHHIKLHGALYMHAARDRDFSAALIKALQQSAPTLPVYCMQSTALYQAATEAGQPVVREFFADRDYNAEGQLVFVRRTQALDPQTVAERVMIACREGRVRAIDDEWSAVDFDSICIHSDTPGADQLIAAIVESLHRAGIAVAPPAAAEPSPDQ
ncbi:5-oxoprolinase subunit PxpA [Phytohalomonas tamaricis]|uniref:5-oxoprolinase subunit PxpA n=1 Tax=Phytohalomonas tamaricis TaxID=2081032 RepID=UPI000D0B3B57|nr:5-oxoprolinase subunit PxpA [Phytohalomonas tamaricis]